MASFSGRNVRISDLDRMLDELEFIENPGSVITPVLSVGQLHSLRRPARRGFGAGPGDDTCIQRRPLDESA